MNSDFYVFHKSWILGKYLCNLVIVFLDSILISSNSKEEYEEHLRLELQVLKEH